MLFLYMSETNLNIKSKKENNFFVFLLLLYIIENEFYE